MNCIRVIARHSLMTAVVFLSVSAMDSASAEKLKIGLLKFGTVNWFADVIKHHKLDEEAGFELEIIPLASKNATSVALLSNSVESIVTDWFWTLRERARGEDFVLVPYSAALGAVIVPRDSVIKTIADLRGKKIGVAGGPLDKSWLLLRAYAQTLVGEDLSLAAEPVYGAPPLLSQLLIKGDIDAVLNFWHYAARLEGSGYRRIAGVDEIVEALGISPSPPMIGFVFRQRLADEKPELIEGFITAAVKANKLLLDSDEEWQRIRPMMGVNTDQQFEALRDRFRAGALLKWGASERTSAGRVFDIIRQAGGEKLTGKGVKFDAGVFWPGLVY